MNFKLYDKVIIKKNYEYYKYFKNKIGTIVKILYDECYIVDFNEVIISIGRSLTHNCKDFLKNNTGRYINPIFLKHNIKTNTKKISISYSFNLRNR